MLDTIERDTIKVSVVVTTKTAFDSMNTDTSLTLYDVSRRFVLNEYEDENEFMVAVNNYVTKTLGDTSENRIIKYLDPFYHYVSKKTPDKSLNLRIIGDTVVEESVWQLFDLDENDLGVFVAWYSLYEMSKEDVELTLLQAKEYYIGYFSSVEEFAKHSVESSGDLENIPKYLADHIDFEAVGNEILGKGFIKEANNHYFNNY